MILRWRVSAVGQEIAAIGVAESAPRFATRQQQIGGAA